MLTVHYGLTTGRGYLVLDTGFILPLVSNLCAYMKCKLSEIGLVFVNPLDWQKKQEEISPRMVKLQKKYLCLPPAALLREL